jgi:ATP-dependent DNA helicase RecG
MPPFPESGIPAPAAPRRAPKSASRPRAEPDPLLSLKGVKGKPLAALRSLGIATPVDLLHWYPRGHEDRRTAVPIGSLLEEVPSVVRGRVAEVELRRTRVGPLVRVTVEDGTGELEIEFWNQAWREDAYEVGQEVIVSGRLVRTGKLQRPHMSTPEIEVLKGGVAGPAQWGRLVPIYPLTKGIRHWHLRDAVYDALGKHLGEIRDPVPPDLLRGAGLMDLPDAIRTFHFPETRKQAEEARRRLRFDEMLALQVALALRRRSLVQEERRFTYSLGAELDRRIRARFPFPFTAAQDRAAKEILADLAAPHPMNRLLQGDVGSGKTAVALYAMLVAVANRRQAAILAPTEILAEQHLRGFRRALENSRVRVELLAGKMRAKPRRELLAAVKSGEVGVLVATHAVLEGDVDFADLGVAVVDEQHRFGVHQRQAFRKKGLRPDLLYLTATPIPRTVALSIFGDLDVSVLDERPPGRFPVATREVDASGEAEAYELVRSEVAAGRRAFFICPLVEESEALDLRAAEEEAERLRRDVFPDLRVGLLHGRLPAKEKQEVMDDFRAGRVQVLVSTVVVEVGVDVPEASVLAVLHAERFGLSQLHQLRGRIGRGKHRSTCLLFAKPVSEEARRRIDAMVETDDGFRIAEIDYGIRGPGEFFGAKQSGISDLRFPEALMDAPLVARSREAAFALVAKDPDLRLPEHAALRKHLLRRFGGRIDLVRV